MIGRHKFNARKVEYNGIKFDSAMERDHYIELMKDPDVYDLQLQPEFVLQEKFKDQDGKTIRAIKYRADFWYLRHSQPRKIFIVDVKGYQTPDFKIKWKMFRYVYQCYVGLLVTPKRKPKKKAAA